MKGCEIKQVLIKVHDPLRINFISVIIPALCKPRQERIHMTHAMIEQFGNQDDNSSKALVQQELRACAALHRWE